MCGVVGFYDRNQNQANYSAVLKAMSDKIAHRGPDGFGFYHNEQNTVHLAHRRLAILDLSPAGHQPMVSKSGRYTISYNGEIYNHQELRKKVDTNFQWKGTSDTETLLALFESFGLDATVKMIKGMFAIALWDNVENTLTLIRDRFGEKPLYYGWTSESLLFGSDLKSWSAHPSFKPVICQKALKQFLFFGYVPGELSIFENVKKVEPGSYIVFNHLNKSEKDQGLKVKYWDLGKVWAAQVEKGTTLDYNEACNQLETMIDQSVSQQMLSDVPLGACLSGGVDSSLIVSSMCRNSKAKINTFTIGFTEPKYDESGYAAKIAEYLKTDHHVEILDGDKLGKLMPEVIQTFDEPFADPSGLPTLLLAQFIKKHVTVVLSGDAGDELFGGYSRYQIFNKLQGLTSKMPAHQLYLPWVFKQLGGLGFWSLPVKDKLTRLRQIIGQTTDFDKYANLISANSSLKSDLRYDHWSNDLSTTENMMLFDALTYLPGDILVKTDRAFMSVGLEGRVPLLDHELAEFAMRLPDEWKYAYGTGKKIVKELLRHRLPSELIDRPKKGFGIPLGKWLRFELKAWAEDLVNEKNDVLDSILPADTVKKLWQDHLLLTANNENQLWPILVFKSWHRTL